jgi:hypothetical protein
LTRAAGVTRCAGSDHQPQRALARVREQHLMTQPISKAIHDVVEAMMFESWLRFYFVEEDAPAEGAAEGSQAGGDKVLFVRLPAEEAERIRAEHDQLWRLAEAMSDGPVDYATSLTRICSFVSSAYDGIKYPVGTVGEVFNSRDFQLEVYLFNLWLSGHEHVFEAERLSFADWRRIFAEWKSSPEVQRYLAAATANESGAGGSEAIQ